ncbi:MAG: UDP-2,3-diacylglucosamine diphosphatase [Proteobacteria bacterium]|nr:MAG: UDP-2,3-diacylglucosamine diphosphatase [Pseudomonadota bacterium]QKK12000.1 MAG: UDP-2,3-diacylglucosamine diphosphatase [Pseudomonadota bacterium]
MNVADRPTLFISDLHLDEDRPEVVELFYAFLNQRAMRAAALYILGDFFEVWIGDDDDSPLASTVIKQLRRLADRGVPVFLMVGNRDFLIGERFAEMSRCRLLPEPSVIDLFGTPTLLLHGDSLCTDDREYQAFRKQVRGAEWRSGFLARSLQERSAAARELRTASRRRSRDKPQAIMDVNNGAVIEALRTHGVYQLIHGHTHRPAIHRLEVDGTSAQRIVLGDWNDTAQVLVCGANGNRLETFGNRASVTPHSPVD